MKNGQVRHHWRNKKMFDLNKTFSSKWIIFLHYYTNVSYSRMYNVKWWYYLIPIFINQSPNFIGLKFCTIDCYIYNTNYSIITIIFSLSLNKNVHWLTLTEYKCFGWSQIFLDLHETTHCTHTISLKYCN